MGRLAENTKQPLTCCSATVEQIPEGTRLTMEIQESPSGATIDFLFRHVDAADCIRGQNP